MNDQFIGFGLLAILFIVLNELREWRTSKQFKELSTDIDVMDGKLYGLNKAINDQYDTITELGKALTKSEESLLRLENKIWQATNTSEHQHSEMKEFIVKAQSDLATIVNEYKINGIPLGYHRKPVEDMYDSVEGF